MDTYQLTVYALIAGFVLIFWKAAQWAMTSARAARDSESLTPADLMALQEACEGLISDLREVADDATARVNLAVAKAEIVLEKLAQTVPVDAVLARAEVGHPAVDAPEEELSQPAPAEVDLAGIQDPVERVYRLADLGHSCEEIARMENRSPGEVRLILDLRNLQMESQAA
ncbi:MAG: hypothetical protein ACUVSM_07055 [Armatimonadota bacterium]|nr:MAG: hypothetical protein KatS3mg024_2603 [Armatimonadota bacterium]GIV82636.1 MAG: hypothetical protein KatS3mg051_1990 [Anaerolineae bacterium]